jgi:hypothetical protein
VNYPLKDYAKFTGPYYSGEPAGKHRDAKIGIHVECPNCGARGAAYFKNPIGATAPFGRVQWDRTGETLETLTLSPSLKMIGHFHSWIRNGQLCVDSAFECKKGVPDA